MIIINLFKYSKDGEVIVSPEKPEEGIEYEEMFRLVAENGKMLTNDHENWYYVIDVDSTEGWVEEEHAEPEPGPEPEPESDDEENAVEPPESEV